MTGDPAERGLLDTNVVVHLPRLHESVLSAELVINAVNPGELSAGPHHTDDPAGRARGGLVEIVAVPRP